MAAVLYQKYAAMHFVLSVLGADSLQKARWLLPS